jgi:hypothetical protein
MIPERSSAPPAALARPGRTASFGVAGGIALAAVSLLPGGSGMLASVSLVLVALVGGLLAWRWREVAALGARGGIGLGAGLLLQTGGQALPIWARRSEPSSSSPVSSWCSPARPASPLTSSPREAYHQSRPERSEFPGAATPAAGVPLGNSDPSGTTGLGTADRGTGAGQPTAGEQRRPDHGTADSAGRPTTANELYPPLRGLDP